MRYRNWSATICIIIDEWAKEREDFLSNLFKKQNKVKITIWTRMGSLNIFFKHWKSAGHRLQKWNSHVNSCYSLITSVVTISSGSSLPTILSSDLPWEATAKMQRGRESHSTGEDTKKWFREKMGNIWRMCVWLWCVPPPGVSGIYSPATWGLVDQTCILPSSCSGSGEWSVCTCSAHSTHCVSR